MRLYNENNMESLKVLEANSVDSIVTDPPYGLSFMNKKWDYDVPSVEFWREVYRVLKPGGHILSFGGTRTYHRLVVAIEDAGFEIRDTIMWIYGSGFPKSLNIGKAVDKMEGNEREVVGTLENYQDKRGLNGQTENVSENAKPRIDIPLTKGQTEWEGFGTALKPANEPICLARKPLSEKSISENVLRWGTGGLNIDGCRVGFEDTPNPATNPKYRKENGYKLPKRGQVSNGAVDFTSSKNEINTEGRFPANVILECICDEVIQGERGEVKSNTRQSLNFFDETKERKVGTRIEDYGDKGDIHTNSDCPCYIMDEQSGVSKSRPTPNHIRKGNVVADNRTPKAAGIFGDGNMLYGSNHNDKGGSSRFFYRAKVSKKERNLGLDEGEKSTHPTVKPINLLTYLCRLITPPNGVVLDPFMGSGSTGVAALLEGFDFIGMELDKDYYEIAQKRIENYKQYESILKNK